MAHNPAKALVDRIRGIDWINTIPPKFKAALLYITTKVPGVDNSVLEDDLTGDTISSKVTTDRTNERQKETTTLDPTVLADTIYHEQEYDEVFDVIVPTDDYLTPRGAELGMPRREIHGINTLYDEVKKISPDTSVLDNYLLAFPGTTNLQLPDVLTGIVASIEKTHADGSWDETGFAAWSGAGSASISMSGSAEGSAAIMPAITVIIEQPWAHNIPTKHFIFFMPAPVTSAAVVTKLTAALATSVSAWPKFKPRMETVKIIGQNVSVNVRVSSHWQDGGGFAHDCDDNCFGTSEASNGTGSGVSHSLGITSKTVTIPPTIHGSISVSGTLTDTQDGTAAASIGSGSILPISITETATASAQVVASIGATSGASSIPTSGLHILSVDAAPYKYGYVKVHCEVVDFADV